MPRLFVTGPAKNDLRQIVRYLAARSPQGAATVYDRLRREMRLLAKNPRLGRRDESDPTQASRIWTVPPYVIAYRVIGNRLEVLRIDHGARDTRPFAGDG